MSDNRELDAATEDLKNWLTSELVRFKRLRIPEVLEHSISRKALFGLKKKFPSFTNKKIAEIVEVSLNTLKEWVREKNYRDSMTGLHWKKVHLYFQENFNYQGGPASLFFFCISSEEGLDSFDRMELVLMEESEIKRRVKEDTNEIRQMFETE